MELKALNVGDLAKPITKLIETLEKACGGIMKPFQIKRVAKAEAEANIILARGESEVQNIVNTRNKPFDDRGNFIKQRRLKNISQITSKTYLELCQQEAVSDEPVDEDWVVDLFNKAEDISNEEMQSLWAKILAGEITKPGSFSYRTLNFVKTLTKADAQTITKVSSLIFYFNNEEWFLPSALSNASYSENQITYKDIIHMQNIGFLSPTFTLRAPKKGSALTLDYTGFKKHFVANKMKSIFFEPRLLTDIGHEIHPISGFVANQKFYKELVTFMVEEGYQELSTEEFEKKFS